MKPFQFFQFMLEGHSVLIVRLGDRVGFFCDGHAEFMTVSEKDFLPENKEAWKQLFGIIGEWVRSKITGPMPEGNDEKAMSDIKKYLEDIQRIERAFSVEVQNCFNDIYHASQN